jgi:hypothetical protein
MAAVFSFLRLVRSTAISYLLDGNGNVLTDDSGNRLTAN